MTLRIAWLTTGRGPGSYGALAYTLDAIDAGLPVEIAVVFVNRERGEAEPTDRLIALAERRGTPVETLSSVAYRKASGGQRSRPGEPLPAWRYAFDREVAARLGRYQFDLGVMFGYMLIATEPLYTSRVFLNDHPALPDGPVGTYEEVIRELIRTGTRESGCLMNVVTGELDRGPVVSYCRYALRGEGIDELWAGADSVRGGGDRGPAVSDGDPAYAALFAEIRRRGVERERPFLVETLAAIEAGGVEVPPGTPVDLTDEVEMRLAAGAV